MHLREADSKLLMKSINLLLGNIASIDSLQQVDNLISLSPVNHSSTQPLELLDGEQTYELYNLVEQADDLAMKWARTTYAVLASTPWNSLFTYRGIDLHPLIVNRLFRAFFLRQAGTYLGVRRIVEVEIPQRVAIYYTDKVDTLFAQVACLEASVECTCFHLLPKRRRGIHLPNAFHILVHDIALPALKQGFSNFCAPAHLAGVPRILFIERGGVGSRMVVDAFDALHATSDVDITIVRFEPDVFEPEYSKAHYVNWDDYQSLATLARLLIYQMHVMAQRSVPADLKALPGLVVPDVLRFMRQIALPSIVHTLELAHRLIQIEQPNLLVLTDETGLLGKAIAVLGRKLDVPTLNVQHGVRVDSPWVEDQLFDHFAVFGPSTTEVFVNRGNDPAMFISTGVPRYDRLFQRRGIKSRQQVAAELGLDRNRPIVTFASQRAWGRMTPAVKRETLLALLRACQRTNMHLILKLRHGQSDYVPPEATVEPGWEQVRVIAEYDLYDLLNASDIVVTAYSTVGMEAVALGKPLLIINLTGQPDPIPYVQEGVAIGVYQADQVSQVLQHLLGTASPNPEWMQCRQKFIRRHLTSDDGRSAERVAQLMLDMMQRPS